MGTFFDLAEKRTVLNLDRSVPLGRLKLKLIRLTVFSHSVLPSGPETVSACSVSRLVLERCATLFWRVCAARAGT